MKKIIITALVFAGISAAQSQTIYTGDGSLASNRIVTMAGKNLTFKPAATGSVFINGINGYTGINTLTPTVPLEVNGVLKAETGFFTKSPANGQTFATNNDRIKASLSFSAGALVDAATQTRQMYLMDFPQSNMDAAPTVWFGIDDRNYVSRFRIRAVQGAESQLFLFDKAQVSSFQVIDNGSNNVTLTMPKADSRVCIGTTSYSDGTDVYSLSVNGNVRADRVKVYNTWADYVFEEDYKLPTLTEVEQHIKDKGHLQDIPSAAEVEAKGIDLGDMNRLLLQKIEELTLYMIEQNKVNAQQAQQIEELKAQVTTLSEKN